MNKNLRILITINFVKILRQCLSAAPQRLAGPVFVIGDALSDERARTAIDAIRGELACCKSMVALWHLKSRGVLASFRDQLHTVLEELVRRLKIRRSDRFLHSNKFF